MSWPSTSEKEQLSNVISIFSLINDHSRCCEIVISHWITSTSTGRGSRHFSQKDRNPRGATVGKVKRNRDQTLLPAPFNSAPKGKRYLPGWTWPRTVGHRRLKDTFLKYPTNFDRYCLKIFALIQCLSSPKNIIFIPFFLHNIVQIDQLLSVVFLPLLFRKKKRQLRWITLTFLMTPNYHCKKNMQEFDHNISLTNSFGSNDALHEKSLKQINSCLSWYRCRHCHSSE